MKERLQIIEMYYHCDPWMKTNIFNLGLWPKQNYIHFIWAPTKHVFKMVSGSYMDVIFELVAHEESGQVYHTVYQGRPTTVLRVSRVCERY